jgi:hypothetical protein
MIKYPFAMLPVRLLHIEGQENSSTKTGHECKQPDHTRAGTETTVVGA